MELRKDAWGFGASSSPPPQQFPLEILKSFEKRCGHAAKSTEGNSDARNAGLYIIGI
jgi:hypothetical protein